MEESVRKFKRPLPVEMTEEEKIKRGQKAGQLKKAIAKVKAEMKEATADHKERLKQHQSNLDAILDDLETGTEMRSVECFERQDFAKKKSEIVRADTSEVVRPRCRAPSRQRPSWRP
jgi:ferritin-like metal-binding protein YciE